MYSCDDAIASIFSLNSCEKRIVSMLCRKERDVPSLAKGCGKSSPRIAQAMPRLLSLSLVSRKKIPLKRGYKFVYASSGKKAIAALAKKELAARNASLLSALSSKAL